MRRRQLMVGSQRLMQLLILDVRVAFGAAGLSTIACLSEAGIPSGLMLALNPAARRGCQQGGGLADIAAMGAFSKAMSLSCVVIRGGPASRRRRVGFNPGEDRLGHLLLEFGRFQFPLFFHVTDKRRLHQNGGDIRRLQYRKPACSTDSCANY